MAKLIVISWRDIPSQVLVRKGRSTEKVMLSERFQEAIDRAAMRAGKSSSDQYLADWRRADPIVVKGDSKELATEQAQQIEAAYNDERLLELIRAHGVDAEIAGIVDDVRRTSSGKSEPASRDVDHLTPIASTSAALT